MRTGALPAVAAAVLLVLAGCAALPGTTESGPSPEEFPDASAVNQSVYDRHAALLANTNFTVTFETTRERPTYFGSSDGNITNFTWLNSSTRVLAEPGASQYLSQPNGTLDHLGTTTIHSVYSNGTGAYLLKREDNESNVTTGGSPVFNESGDYYLWQGWKETNGHGLYYLLTDDEFARNVTFERTGIETFDGVDVMRYEVSGVDALPDRYHEFDNYTYTDFSVTLLLDADGVIRYYEAELDRKGDPETVDRLDRVLNRTLVHTVTDVGSTDVEKPDWVANATAES